MCSAHRRRSTLTVSPGAEVGGADEISSSTATSRLQDGERRCYRKRELTRTAKRRRMASMASSENPRDAGRPYNAMY